MGGRLGDLIEQMPDSAPPKWMSNNINAIRANTDCILELLAGDRTGTPETTGPPTAAGRA